MTVDVEHDSSSYVSDTNWAAIDALTDEELHIASLSDPDSQPLPEIDAACSGLSKLVNVKKLRERVGLTQEEFARIYCIPLGTLRDWEQRRKNPDRTARAYLMVIDKDPKAIAALLNNAA